ncbi:MAG: hypothetical protein HC780_15830 [Leptolyngbyaceae cyanobacterium CSU_1_3]|nr:hypothetical protein [Leptolyngbyaceae cyanobacterium CSU_1_3]
MQSSSTSSDSEQIPQSFKLNPEILLGMATLPVLVGLVGIQAIAQTVHELGVLSEELFRGDRLPVLDLSEPSDPSKLDKT